MRRLSIPCLKQQEVQMKHIKKSIFLFLSLFLISAEADEFYRDDVKEVVIDKKRDLMWQDDEYSSGQDITFAKAKAYCEELNFAGYDDWYLPKLDKLKTIIDADNYPKSIVDTFKHVASEYYWSASEYGVEHAWMVLFRNASIDYYYKRDTNHLRCVRYLKK